MPNANNPETSPATGSRTAEDKSTLFDGLIARLNAAITDLATLQVTTIVGTPKLAKPPQFDDLDLADIENPRVIISRINLIDGDIVTLLDPAFVPESEVTKVRSFHEERVSEGSDIIKRNLEALKSLLSLAQQYRRESGG